MAEVEKGRTAWMAPWLLLLAAAWMVLALTAGHAHAAILTADTLADTSADDGNCSLREAVTAANMNADVNGADDCDHTGGAADTIQLGAGTYSLTSTAAEDVNASGDLDVMLAAGSLTVLGVSAADTEISAQGQDRVFHFLNAGTAAVRDLSIVGGNIGGPLGGSGIRVQDGATLTVERAELEFNTAYDSGGGAIQYAGSGVLSVIDSVIEDNASVGVGLEVQGAGIDMLGGQLILTRSRVSENVIEIYDDANNGDEAYGGGVRIGPGASATITDSLFNLNVIDSVGEPGDLPRGGGIAFDDAQANSTISRSAFIGNYLSGGAMRSGGGVDFSDESDAADNSLQLENVTFYSNGAGDTNSQGGAISARDGMVFLAHVTSGGGNEAATGQAIHFDDAGDAGSLFRVENSILAEGTEECGGPDPLTSGGHNLEMSPDECGLNGTGDAVQGFATIGLESIAENGGPTQTRAVTGSAVDWVPAGSCSLTVDQRGAPRAFPPGGACDAGAYERNVCLGQLVNRVGTSGADDLGGTAGDDGVLGLGGNDSIDPGPGVDGVCAGEGDDDVYVRDGSGDAVDCGAGAADSVTADLMSQDTVAGCEFADFLLPPLVAAPPAPAPAKKKCKRKKKRSATAAKKRCKKKRK